MIADLDYGLLPDESEDHFLGLEQAQLVGTDTLLTTRDNIEAVIEAKAMMCDYGPAGSGKTMSVNSAPTSVRAPPPSAALFSAPAQAGLTTPPTKTRASERRIALRESSSQMT
ncbi:hypothetical protein ACFYPZ_36715 [Streptomyces sp. NPDC005506]|uniref:hypothetical protein n=1 Tax=unclassified Streptomyces TaxID=2593676 RepID=UPI00369F407A